MPDPITTIATIGEAAKNVGPFLTFFNTLFGAKKKSAEAKANIEDEMLASSEGMPKVIAVLDDAKRKGFSAEYDGHGFKIKSIDRPNEPELTLSQRAEVFDFNQREFHQKNFEAIASQVIHKLESDSRSQAEKPIQESFMREAFDASKNIDEPDLQAMWASLIAEEVILPESIPLRAVHTLKQMSKTDAKAFHRLCCGLVNLQGGVGLLITSREELPNGIAFDDYALAIDLGLLSSKPAGRTIVSNPGWAILGKSELYILPNAQGVTFKLLRLTAVGSAFYQVADMQNESLLSESIIKMLSRYTDQINQHDNWKFEGDTFRYFEPHVQVWPKT